MSENTTTATQTHDPEFSLTIRYNLTTAGQEAAIRAGLPAQRDQKITGTIPYSRGKRLGLGLSWDGKAFSNDTITLPVEPKFFSTRTIYNDSEIARLDAPLNFAEAVEFFEKSHAEYQRYRAEQRATMTALLAEYLAGGEREPLIDWLTEAQRNELAAERKRRQQAAEQARREREAAKQAEAEAAEAAREAAKQAQIAEWVAAHGSANQRERFAAGFLPKDEAWEAIASIAFAPLGDWQRYSKITADDVRATCHEHCTCNQYGCDCDTSFVVFPAEEMSADHWDEYQRITALMPEAEITLREHRGQCDGSNCPSPHGVVRQNGWYVKVTVGAFTFNREYQVG